MSEIDVKIARIMGMPVFERSEDFHRSPLNGFLILGDVVQYDPDLRWWQPSKRLEHAMQVVARMRDDWFSFKAWQPSKMPYNPGDPPLEIGVVSFVCSMGPCSRHKTTHHNHHGAYDVEGETLPMAICKAALIALKAE